MFWLYRRALSIITPIRVCALIRFQRKMFYLIKRSFFFVELLYCPISVFTFDMMSHSSSALDPHPHKHFCNELSIGESYAPTTYAKKKESEPKRTRDLSTHEINRKKVDACVVGCLLSYFHFCQLTIEQSIGKKFSVFMVVCCIRSAVMFVECIKYSAILLLFSNLPK